MSQSLLILGRQPSLGLAELESLYGGDSLTPIGKSAVILSVDPADVDFSRLGGSVKLAGVLTELETTDWSQLVTHLIEKLPEHAAYRPEGKIKFGLSVYGLNVTSAQINKSNLAIKKAVKTTGRSIRVVPNNEPALNSAQVLHNQLTGDLGMELLLVRNGSKTILAQTLSEQDIASYAARDQQRPKRDAQVGMLPPKLAQIIINLATGTIKTVDKTSKQAAIVLDPFCGTGVILQEATLMGYDIYGTDLEPRMIEYSGANLDWLFGPKFSPELEAVDATSALWHAFTTIACETYLGRPFSATPKPEVLTEVMQDVNHIHKKFLANVAAQTKTGFRMCIAVPAWKTTQGFKHLKVLDSLEELGYTRLKFVHAGDQDLIYHREGQIVARELVVLQRK